MAQETSTAAIPPTSGFWSEIESLKTPSAKEVAEVPKVGTQAPSSPKVQVSDGRPVLVVFLRHCGCPFAEKTFKRLAALSDKHPEVRCVAVSHSSAEATDRWLPQVGGAWNIEVVVDSDRDIYAMWGLGTSSTWHVASPMVMYSVFRLGKDEGVWNRPTESGSRWQTGGAFAIDKEGVVRWAHRDATADDLPDLSAALTSLGIEEKKAASKT